MRIERPTLLLLFLASGMATTVEAQTVPATYTGYTPRQLMSPGMENSGLQGVHPAVGGNPALYEYYRQVSHQSAPKPLREPKEPSGQLPPDPWGRQRLELPTPVAGHGFAGQSPLGLNTSPDAKTMGIRLDTTYGLIRSIDIGGYYSEHQHLGAVGGTILPFQSPCCVIGTRVLGAYTDQLSMVADTGALSVDLFWGTRYKTTYLKVGPFWDWQIDVGKVGVAFSMLAKAPIIEFITVDSAFGFGVGDNLIGPETDPYFGIYPRRVESADFDMQIRVGTFLSERVQVGVTGNYYDYEFNYHEWGAGAFANIYVGRVRFGLDVTGGDEGLRGYTTMSFGWGASRTDRPQDCRFIPVDTVAWVTRATDRDISVRLRETFTGNPPPAPVP